MAHAHAARVVEGTFSSKDALKLFDRAWVPEGPPRAVLVVVHGLKDHSGRYASLGEAMSSRGWIVAAADLRGHGRSEGKRAFVRAFDDYLDDLGLLFAELEKGHPGLPTFLFGHSMGGAIATRYVLERKPKLQGLVLSGAALRAPPTVSAFAIRFTKFLSRIAPGAGVFKLPDEDFSRDPAQVQAIREDPLIHHKGAPARTAAELLGSMEKNRAEASKLSVPLWIIHGTADKLTDPRGSEELFGAASSADKTYKPYQGLYHDLLHEPEREQVLSDLAAWLTTRLGAA